MDAIRFEHVTKKFGSKFANEDISFSIHKGEIISILGENGCGKTSLMNVVAGIYTPDEGRVYINEELASIKSPKDAYTYGVGMVHQHFKLVDIFTATENVVLGLTKTDYKNIKNRFIESEEARIANLNLEGEALDKELANSAKRIKKSGKYNLKLSKEIIQGMCDKYGFVIDLNKKVYEMSVSEKQTLEIIKVLFRGVNTLILDEPTAVLTPQEIKHLFTVLRKMREDGKTVIIITHKLNEVMEISNRVAILRKGNYISTVNTSETNERELADMMMGRKLHLNIDRPEPVNPVDRLFVNNLTLKGIDGTEVLHDITFTARSGEILGVAGIAGSGQRELFETIAGLYRGEQGTILFQNPKKDAPVSFFHKDLRTVKHLASLGSFYYKDSGKQVDFTNMKNKEIREQVAKQNVLFYEDETLDLKDKTPLEIRQLGIRLSFVPEDRLGMGLVGDMGITDNMMLRSYRKGKGMFLNRKTPAALAEEIVDELEISTPNLSTPVRRLSGGNIQKVLVGREISFAPKVLMAAYPVRGLDINSSYTIYNLLNEQKKKGTAVIFVGEDIDVLLALCDRLLVMANGRITGIVDPKTVSKEEVGLLMTKTVE